MTWASAAFEYDQAQGWAEVARMMPTAEGISLGEGLPQTSWLGVQEVTLSFGLEEVPESRWARLGRAVRRLFGGASTAPRRFRFAPAGGNASVSIQVRVFRKPDGSYGIEQQGTARMDALLGAATERPALRAGGA